MFVGLLDTSVVIDWDDPAIATALPGEAAISAITLAELTAGPHLTSSGAERARRQARLQQVEAIFDAIAFDVAAARSYGQVVAAVLEIGRSNRRRSADLLIAATAHANGLQVPHAEPGRLRRPRGTGRDRRRLKQRRPFRQFAFARDSPSTNGPTEHRRVVIPSMGDQAWSCWRLKTSKRSRTRSNCRRPPTPRPP
jgi:predicted nucleic acid-binding protein